MNYSNMTHEELLRYAEPDTELEKALFKILSGASLESYECVYCGPYQEQAWKSQELLRDLETKITGLKKLLDDNNKDYE